MVWLIWLKVHNALPTHWQTLFQLESSSQQNYLRRYEWLKTKRSMNAVWGRKGLTYEFSHPTESNIETCTSFYVFSGLRWLTGRVGYWTPTQPHHRSSASCHWMPLPRHHYLWHTIWNECTSWFSAIRVVRQEPVPFLNNTKLLLSSCWCTVAIDDPIDWLKHVIMIQKVI